MPVVGTKPPLPRPHKPHCLCTRRGHGPVPTHVSLDWAAASWGSALGLRARGCGACRLRQWPFTVPDLRLYGNTYSLTSTVDGTPIHYSFKSFTLDGREQRDLSRRPRKRGRSEQPRARRWWWALYELVHHTSIRFEWC